VKLAIETARGLLVASLRAAGYEIYPINPQAVDRYRDRHHLAGGKSDAADAMALAHILRTDACLHRPLPADSPPRRRSRYSPRSPGPDLEPPARGEPAAAASSLLGAPSLLRTCDADGGGLDDVGTGEAAARGGMCCS